MSCAEFFGACSLSASMISLTCARAERDRMKFSCALSTTSTRACWWPVHRAVSAPPLRLRTLCWIEGRALLGNADQRPKQEVRRLAVETGEDDQSAQVGEVVNSESLLVAMSVGCHDSPGKNRFKDASNSRQRDRSEVASVPAARVMKTEEPDLARRDPVPAPGHMRQWPADAVARCYGAVGKVFPSTETPRVALPGRHPEEPGRPSPPARLRLGNRLSRGTRERVLPVQSRPLCRRRRVRRVQSILRVRAGKSLPAQRCR